MGKPNVALWAGMSILIFVVIDMVSDGDANLFRALVEQIKLFVGI